MTKILSVVEVVEAIRQRHIHLKANNPVGFVHLFADIKKALQAQRDAGARESLNAILESGLLEEKDISAFDNDPIHPVRANYTGHNTLARDIKEFISNMDSV